MQLIKSNVLILFALVFNVFIGPASAQWVEIRLKSRKTLGSAYTITDFFQIDVDFSTFRIYEAYEWISTAPGTNYYWVAFTVESTTGTIFSCYGEVLWDHSAGLEMTPYNHRCVPKFDSN